MRRCAKINLCRGVAILGHGLMWTACAAICGGAGAARSADLPSGPVTQEGIAITLPIFVTAVAATIACTWAIAKYDLGRNVRIRRLEHRLCRVEERLERLMRLLDAEELRRIERTPADGAN